MINGYKTIQELASEWDISNRRLQVLCAEGKIPGAVKFGRSWAIPETAEKPKDGRITTGEYVDWKNKTKIQEND